MHILAANKHILLNTIHVSNLSLKQSSDQVAGSQVYLDKWAAPSQSRDSAAVTFCPSVSWRPVGCSGWSDVLQARPGQEHVSSL